MNLNSEPSLEAIIDDGFRTVHLAGSMAARILREHATETSELASIPLVMKFKQTVEQAGFDLIVLPSRMEYAERLAVSPGQLLYEEMHKLLGLCEEVLALQSFGYEVHRDIVEQYVASVSARLYAQNATAVLVCEDLELPAAHHFWRRSGITHPAR